MSEGIRDMLSLVIADRSLFQHQLPALSKTSARRPTRLLGIAHILIDR